MQLLLAHNMCWDVINEDVIADLNRLGHHMWQSEVQSEEYGMNLQKEDTLWKMWKQHKTEVCCAKQPHGQKKYDGIQSMVNKEK
jgi:hypothetical protein